MAMAVRVGSGPVVGKSGAERRMPAFGALLRQIVGAVLQPASLDAKYRVDAGRSHLLAVGRDLVSEGDVITGRM